MESIKQQHGINIFRKYAMVVFVAFQDQEQSPQFEQSYISQHVERWSPAQCQHNSNYLEHKCFEDPN